MGRQLTPLFTCLGLVAIGVARVLMLWNRLPTTVASHFGASGQPNAYMGRGSFLWLLGGICLVTIAALAGAPLWLRLVPASQINVPNRDYWMKTPERQRAARARIGLWTAWFAVPTTAVFLGALELSLQANLARAPLDNVSFLLMLGLYFAATIYFTVRFFRSFRVTDGS